MIISCMGHAKFVIELDNGLRIVTDPYDASCGYPVTANPADVVLVSHQHHDHNAVETIPGNPRVIDRAGDFDLGGGAAVRAIEAYHDEQQGKLRGKTLLFCLKAEGLTVMHLGDLGHMLTTEQRLLLGSADIVMLPVGGYYTMDAPMSEAGGGCAARAGDSADALQDSGECVVADCAGDGLPAPVSGESGGAAAAAGVGGGFVVPAALGGADAAQFGECQSVMKNAIGSELLARWRFFCFWGF